MNYSCLRLAAGLVIGVSLASCGLISPDVTDFDLTLPDKKFTIDIGTWPVDGPAARSYLMEACSGETDPTAFCNNVVKNACATGCSGSCGASDTCALSLDISLYQSINLVMERPELTSVNDKPAIKVTIDSVTYDVTSNSLNVDTPELTLYVAPMSVVKSTDSKAKPIGTIAAVPAGWVTEHSEAIKFTATGKAELVNIMNTFKTPFNVLVGSSLLVTAEPVPTGKLDAIVHIKAHAGL
jgi:hypothetical protein